MILYFIAIAFGLSASLRELQHAKALHRYLIETKTNGSRQMLARFSVKEEWLRVLVQVVLLAAIFCFFARARGMAMPSDLWLVMGRALHLFAVALLSFKSWTCRRDRLTLMDVLRKENRQNRKHLKKEQK